MAKGKPRKQNMQNIYVYISCGRKIQNKTEKLIKVG